MEQGAETIDMLGARIAIVARRGEADDDTVLIRSTMEPNAAVPLHAHADVECFYILEGQVEVFLAAPSARWRKVDAGGSLLIPSNVRHAVRNAAKARADVILATTVRMARFFKEIGRPAQGDRQAPPDAEALARVNEAAERYGYWMASPDESAAITS